MTGREAMTGGEGMTGAEATTDDGPPGVSIGAAPVWAVPTLAHPVSASALAAAASHLIGPPAS
ncbi:MAG TPA: hypothetical protein VIJ96_07615 [Acidothermaceae bacterium]